jgi:hypothetical protein
MRSQYVSAPGAYVNYFVEQAGGGGSIYRGMKVQRGYGLGSIFSRMFRFAMPMLKRGVKHVGKTLGKTGASFLTDAVSGVNMKEAAKSHLKAMGKSLAGDAAEYVTDQLGQQIAQQQQQVVSVDEDAQTGSGLYAWRPNGLLPKNLGIKGPKGGHKRKRAPRKNHSSSKRQRSKIDTLTFS